MKRFNPTELSKAVRSAMAMETHESKMAAALELSDTDRLAFFYFTRVMHPKLKLLLQDLEFRRGPFSVEDITLLIGPTGIGKTTTTSEFYDRIVTKRLKDMKRDPRLIPVIKLEAPATGEIQFSHRVFFTKMLHQLHTPLIKTKHSPEDVQRICRTEGLSRLVAGLRLDVEAALEDRGCTDVLIDEAFHLVGGGGAKLAAQINGFKSLSNMSKAKFLLVGSYDLLPILEISGQLTRRNAVIHLGRYHRDIEEDRVEFATILSKLTRLLPLRDQPNLLGYADLLMYACVGIPGILKETLQRALGNAIAAKGWSASCLEQALLTKKASTQILNECIKGEEKVRDWVSGTAKFEDYESPFEEENADHAGEPA